MSHAVAVGNVRTALDQFSAAGIDLTVPRTVFQPYFNWILLRDLIYGVVDLDGYSV